MKDSTCLVDICDNQDSVKGYCIKHYSVFNRNGFVQEGADQECVWCGTVFRNARKKPYCKENCRWAHHHSTNREKISAKNARYREENRDELLRKNREYWHKNQVQLKASALEYRKARREEINLKAAAYRDSNREKINASVAEYRHSNPDKILERNRRRRARLAGNRSFAVTQRDIQRLVERHDGRCVYCHEKFNESSPMNLDHVIPVALGGGHGIGNLVPACESCNCSKGAKLLIEWLNWKRKVEESIPA